MDPTHPPHVRVNLVNFLDIILSSLLLIVHLKKVVKVKPMILGGLPLFVG